MESKLLKRWLDAWQYSESPEALHFAGQALKIDHPYRAELNELLRRDGEVQAHAVFDVEGVPTVCFLTHDGQQSGIDAIRQKIWNQNLISLILTIDTSDASVARALPVSQKKANYKTIQFSEAKAFGHYSRADIQSGEIFSRHKNWFQPEDRVDRELLRNLSVIVRGLEAEDIDKLEAQFLLAQVMFISYLEHRQIIGDTYRQSRGVGSLAKLIQSKNKKGISELLECLKQDFNGDLLVSPAGKRNIWNQLSNSALEKLNDFLNRVNLETGQQDFWNYDFRFIPVELISGIYESFLSEEKKSIGAYYTPRHLATLVVNQALSQSKNMLDETIYDGACGSGILLTTAYRRILAHAEAIKNRHLSFHERITLLKKSIYGSDINESACRVTAFSLYLSVLENLQPNDIAELNRAGKSRLPTLIGENIRAGQKEGDFFSPSNDLANSRRFTLFLCNPPWVEPPKEALMSSDKWAKQNKYQIPRRQVCAAFLLKAADSLTPDGRICFILPVSVLAAHTSQKFIQALLTKYRIETLINFGDIRKLLFDEAKQPTLIMLATVFNAKKQSSAKKHFEYWVPKADVSLSFSRLALHGADRHILPLSSIAFDNSALTTLFWGNQQDLATLARLKMAGTLGELFEEQSGWNISKGFHKEDAAQAQPTSARQLKDWQYLDARKFALNGPLLDSHTLVGFPSEIRTIARLPKLFPKVFKGPRIVFTDGLTSEREIRAAYTSKAFSFSSSVGVINAPNKNEDLLRFLAVYLHSDLVRYYLIMTAYQISFERERVSLQDIQNLPFVVPKKHKDQKEAQRIISAVSKFVRDLEDTASLNQARKYESWKKTAEELINTYFGISKSEAARIEEVVKYILPSMQPASYSSLYTPLQTRAVKDQVSSYAKVLLGELNHWKKALKGKGSFALTLYTGSGNETGELGIVRIDVSPKENPEKISVVDNAVYATLKALKEKKVYPFPLQENLYLMPDVVIRHDDSLYFIKPLIKRLWLRGEAFQDAERIVRHIQGQV